MDIRLKPKHQYELLRIGNKNDGGYLVEKSSFQNSDFLIGLGINDDWSFEKKFKKNFIGVDSKNNPLVLEISYSKNPKKTGDTSKLLNLLDRPNDIKRRELNLNFIEK